MALRVLATSDLVGPRERLPLRFDVKNRDRSSHLSEAVFQVAELQIDVERHEDECVRREVEKQVGTASDSENVSDTVRGLGAQDSDDPERHEQTRARRFHALTCMLFLLDKKYSSTADIGPMTRRSWMITACAPF